jgi:mRNA interferase RelE/StbE
LVGPLQGYFRICYSRYRAIYSVKKERLASGEVVQTVTVLFVAAGIRKEGSKDDIYRFALRLIKLGVISPRPDQKNAT